MKKVINGKMYNTETATEIASYDNGLGCSDFRHMSEALYKTKKGSFFLCGEGGPMTKYSRPCGDMTSGGNDIIPLDTYEAQEWMESHDVDADMIADNFEIEDA